MDVAMTRNSAGKLTFAKNAAGGFYLDNTATYAVFCALFAHKGKYQYAPELGTFLHKTRKDGRLTGSKLGAACTDALEQVRQARLISAGSATAERASTGAWALKLNWTVPGSPRPITEEVSL